MAKRYPIRIGTRSRPVVLLWGATPETAYVELDGDVAARFGVYRLRIPISNISRWRIEGPWQWIKAIGVRRSIRGGDVSFAGDARGGVRLDLREPVRWGPLRVPALSVGVEDLDAFAAELAARDIRGEDARQG